MTTRLSDEVTARALAAQARAAQAYARLLRLAETGRGEPVACVVRFLLSTWDGEAFPFDPFELQRVDAAASDDMLACLDALRWGRAELYTLVPDGEEHMRSVIDRWGLTPRVD